MKKMAQYFLDVEDKTKHDEETSQKMMNSLKAFYLRYHQEMKDVAYQTKLYFPFCTALSPQDKKTAVKILDVFSWLLYDYYPIRQPEPLRKITVINSRELFSEKKEWIVSTTGELLRRYPVNQT